MLFSSVTFLYYFLPITLAVYFIVGKRAKNIVLLLASVVFYFYGEPIYTFLLLFSSALSFFFGLYIEKNRGEKKAKTALIISIVVNVLILVFFKYIDFFIVQINSIFSLSMALLDISLPLGISFFTFQTMSYNIDVYRGDVRAEKNILTLATYVCLFPQLVAGPIVRYDNVCKELENRKISQSDVADGIFRFSIGLSKKVLIANVLGEAAMLLSKVTQASVLLYWLYAISFTLQIYFDFSGYSDMAIGLGKMFGFTFPENFNYPYISLSITEFWRRWHITLSRWFRDYVYIPLGGNRVSKLRWGFNMLLVWFLTGFWHGAGWNFIVWGLYFAVLLILEKTILKGIIEKTPKFFRHIYTMLLVIIGFVIFNSDALISGVEIIKAMFGFGSLSLGNSETLYYIKSYGVILLVGAFFATDIPKKAVLKLSKNEKAKVAMFAVKPILIAALLLISTAFIIDGSFNPFLYFRF